MNIDIVSFYVILCFYCKYIFIAWLLVWLHQLSLCSMSPMTTAKLNVQYSHQSSPPRVWSGQTCGDLFVRWWQDGQMLPGSLAWPESTGWPEVFTSCFTPLLRLTQTTAGGWCVPVIRGSDDMAMCFLSGGTSQNREADVCEREPHTSNLLPH